jgi:3-dehydroquinate synthase
VIALRCAPAGATATAISVGVDLCAGLPSTNHAEATTFALLDAALLPAHAARLAGLERRVLLEGGEAAKTIVHLERVLRELAAAGLQRRDRLLVCGGGSLGDLGGLAAALYLRGIELAFAPTTLLAMVDSSVGGKTAIDLPEGKNLVGAIHPARDVVIDLAFLATLPESEYRSGLGEVLKIAIGRSAQLFELLETERAAIAARRPEVLGQVIAAALRAKIELVESDLHERGPRRLLNLGHTLGHALEAAAQFTLPHGHAVARGLHFAIDLAERRGALAPVAAARCRRLLSAYGFVADPLPPRARLLPFLRRDKKASGEAITFVLPTAIGESAVQIIAVGQLADALD